MMQHQEWPDIEKTWSSKEQLFPGIWVYRDVITADVDVINRVESLLSKGDPAHQWNEATVGYREKRPEYRDCFDYKLRNIEYPGASQNDLESGAIWKDLYSKQLNVLTDYSRMYNINLTYWEAMNFIKYGPGQHFYYHADHGFSYISTVSLVAYPNDNYTGGGLRFDKLDLEIKPKAGDLYVFPSSYLFSHAALPVGEGTKYSIVTMTDYNDAAHQPDFYKQFATAYSIKE
jgi:hypothetical protein